MASIPDYYCGILIGHDEGSRSFPWWGYDGAVEYRAMTRKEVEDWAMTHAHLASDEDIFVLQSVYYRITSCRAALLKLKDKLPPPTSILLEQRSLECAKLAAAVDVIIAQLIDHNGEASRSMDAGTSPNGHQKIDIDIHNDHDKN